jgi:hypothetical protein
VADSLSLQAWPVTIGIGGGFSGPSESMFTQWVGCPKMGKYLHQLAEIEKRVKDSGEKS